MIDHCYGIADAAAIDLIRPELARWFEGIRETTGSQKFEVLDSFDWRLFNKGWLLLNARSLYTIVDISSRQEIGTLTADEKKPLRFLWDFPESDLAAILKNVLEMRALLSLGVVTQQWIHWDLLNRDEKIVARLALETYAVTGGSKAVYQCRLMPVRGYFKSVKRIADCLNQLGLQPVEQSPFLTLLEQKGHAPGGYSSKISITLKPETPAAEAVRYIMGNLISVIQVNLPGVQQDIDSEFLHDFRVSVRRARSLLSQMKGVLDAGTTANLQRRLKAMGGVSGSVRDLDVYLLKKSEYMDKVPDFLKPGINQLFGTLQRKRRHAKDRMVRTMAGTDFKSALSALDAFVGSDLPADSDAPGGSRPIGKLAKEIIYRRFQKIIKKGNQISDATADERLHDLRIDCKKLRYSLEFFASLFPEDQMKMLVKQLKQLQENLGDFNDLSVQQDFLIKHLQALRPQAARVVIMAAATGGLITRLYMAQRQVRSQFLSVFSEFSARENRERFKTLFA